MDDGIGSTPEDRQFPVPQTNINHPLDSVLLSLGLALRGLEVEAYMKDELRRGRSSLTAVVNRVLKGHKSDPRHDYPEFTHLISKLWHKVRKEYDPSQDQIAGVYRSQALEILDGNLRQLRKLDAQEVNPDFLGQNSSFLLTSLMALICQFLGTLDEGKKQDLQDPRLKRLLESMTSISSIIIQAVEKQVKRRASEQRREISKIVH